MKLRAYAPLAIGSLTLLLAGCELSPPSAAGPPGTPAPTPATTATTTPTNPTSTTDPTDATDPSDPSDPSDPTSPAPASAGSGRCRTNELRVTVQPSPGGGAAGSMWQWLVFTNRSTRTCTLYGFPGVSFVTGASGTQVNEPARRDGSQSVLVTLAPGQAGHATMRTGHNEAFPDTCQPVPIAGYRVYVPDETASVFVSQAGEACSTKGVNSMSISPVYPGNTE